MGYVTPHNDPTFGPDEIVPAVLIGFRYHLVLETDSGWQTWEGQHIEDRDVIAIKAKHISCKRCRRQCNV